MNAWRAPKRVFDAHPPDQRAQLRVDLRSPSQRARLPTPVAAKAGPVPTQERLGPDDRKDLQDRRNPAVQLDKESAIMVRKPDATMEPAPQDIQLMSKQRVLSFKLHLRLEWRGQDGQDETEQSRSFGQLRRFHRFINSDQVFGTHTGRRRVDSEMWQGYLQPLDLGWRPLSPSHISYSLVLLAPYHRHEQKNFEDRIAAGIANLEQHCSRVQPDECRMLFLRLPAPGGNARSLPSQCRVAL